MLEFDVTISAIIQFVGDPAYDNPSREIFKAINLKNEKVRYVFLSFCPTEKLCKIDTYYTQCGVAQKIIHNRDIYEPGGILPEFFQDHVLKENDVQVNSKRHFLITIGHGGGFVFFNNTVNEIKENISKLIDGNNMFTQETIDKDISEFTVTLQKKYNIAANLFKSSKLPPPPENFIDRYNLTETGKKIVNEFRSKEKDTKYITAFEFAQILKKAFEKNDSGIKQNTPPIDMIIHVNCFLQTFETGYIFRDVTKYLCASEVGMPALGINYYGLFNAFSNNTSIDNSIISILITQTFSEGRSERGLSISVNSLENYGLLYTAIDLLALSFIQLFKEPMLNNLSLEKNLFGLRDQDGGERDLSVNFGFIEIVCFLEDLYTEITKGANEIPRLEYFFNQIKTIITSAPKVIASVYSNMSSLGKVYPKAFGMFFPIRSYPTNAKTFPGIIELIDLYLSDSSNMNVFTANTNWDDFLRKYIQYKLPATN